MSQLSICPPNKTISSGYSDPVISAITLDDVQSSTYSLSIFKWTTIFYPLSLILKNILASSTEIAAAGILVTPD